MKKNRVILGLNIITLIISLGSFMYIYNFKNSVYDLNKENIIYNDNCYVKANKDYSFFLPDLNKNKDIFWLSENNKSLILSNPKENDLLIKYEIYFKDLNFSIDTNCIPAGSSEEIMLYDLLDEGTYNIIVKMNFWYDENTLWNEAIYSFETPLNIIKNTESRS